MFNWFIFGVGLVLLVSCGSIKVVSYQTPNTDFSKFSSYNINSNENFSAKNMEEKDKLEGAIINEMDSRGFLFAQKPDIQIDYQIILGSETRVSNDRQIFPYYGNYYRFNTINVDRYNEGILLVEARQNKKILWQGSLDLKYNSRSKKRKDIAELIGLLFDEFPVMKPGAENAN